jgi:chromosome segregation ATPase
MVMRKGSSQKATSKNKSPRTKGSPRPPSSTTAGRFALLLEEMDHRNKAVIEAVFSTRDELKREFNVKFDALSERVSSLELAVRDSTARLGALEARVQSHDEKLTRMEARLDRIEARLDCVETKLDDKADKADILVLAQRLAPLERAVAS